MSFVHVLFIQFFFLLLVFCFCVSAFVANNLGKISHKHKDCREEHTTKCNSK